MTMRPAPGTMKPWRKTITREGKRYDLRPRRTTNRSTHA